MYTAQAPQGKSAIGGLSSTWLNDFSNRALASVRRPSVGAVRRALNSDAAQRTSSPKAAKRICGCIRTRCGFLFIGKASLVRYGSLEFPRFDGQEELPRSARTAWALMAHVLFGSGKRTISAAPPRPAHMMHGGTRASEATRELVSQSFSDHLQRPNRTCKMCAFLPMQLHAAALRYSWGHRARGALS
jgi:hypothetical protein